MHELAVTESILSTVIKHGEQANAEKVTDVYLIIGALSSIIDDSVQFYWDIIIENTICAGSKLHFERIPAKIECQACHHIYELFSELIPCPICNSTQAKVIAGDEFRVDSIEVTIHE